MGGQTRGQSGRGEMGQDPNVSPDGRWRRTGTEWVPNVPAPRRPLHHRRPFWLAIGLGALLLGTWVVIGVAANRPQTYSQDVSPEDVARHQARPIRDTPVPAATPTPGMSDEQARQAVLNYKACTQYDDLQTMLAYVFNLANDQPKGTDVIGRQGDVVRVATTYVERGQSKRAIFDYHLSSGQVTGEDQTATGTVEALQAECK